jgi:hypothetical protein
MGSMREGEFQKLDILEVVAKRLLERFDFPGRHAGIAMFLLGLRCLLFRSVGALFTPVLQTAGNFGALVEGICSLGITAQVLQVDPHHKEIGRVWLRGALGGLLQLFYRIIELLPAKKHQTEAAVRFR